MAEALKTFVKAFCREFSGVPECQVLASYDNAVKSKYDASRVYRLSPQDELARAQRSFSATSRYASFAHLVRDRTARGSRVAKLLDENARDVAHDLEATGRIFLDIDLRKELKANFIRTDAFRTAFSAALQADGLAYDLTGFWQAIDDETGRLDMVLADNVETIKDVQRGVIAACVYASLAGARDNRQEMGFALRETPVGVGGIAPVVTDSALREAQLVPVVMAGPDPLDYSTQLDDGARAVTVYRFSETQGARIGREDRAWCADRGRCPVVTRAAYASRHHCEITFDCGRWTIADVGTDGQGSRYGTLVTPADLEALPVLLQGDSCELHHGDLICIFPRRVLSGDYCAANFSWASRMRDENYRFEVLG